MGQIVGSALFAGLVAGFAALLLPWMRQFAGPGATVWLEVRVLPGPPIFSIRCEMRRRAEGRTGSDTGSETRGR